MLRTLSAFCIITAVKSRKAHLTRHIFSRSIFQCSRKLNMNKKYYKEMYLKFHVGPSLCFRKAHLFTCSPDSSNQVSHAQTLEIYISWTSSCRPSRKQDEGCSWILKETGEQGCRRSAVSCANHFKKHELPSTPSSVLFYTFCRFGFGFYLQVSSTNLLLTPRPTIKFSLRPHYPDNI